MRWLEHLEEGLIAFLMAAMTLTAFGQVVARYVFNYSFVWALELNGVFFAWLIFVGMSYGVRVGAHIGIDAVVRTLRPGAARAVAMVAAALCIVYAAIVMVGGAQYVRKMYDVGIEMQDMPVQQWIPRIVLPLGFALLGLRFAQALARLWRGEETGLLHDEAEEALKLKPKDVDLGEVRE
jgi:C4-dicarboxylate transporter DctQ subunit